MKGYITKEQLSDSLKQDFESLDLQLNSKLNKVESIEVLENKSFNEGDIVFIENFYNNIKNNSHHYRIISNTDNGTGVLLKNNMYANIIFQDEIDISWLGARNSNNGEVYDIKPYIDKIINIDPLPKIKIGSGFWGISTNNYSKHGLQIYGVTEQPIWKFPSTDLFNSTVLFPIDDEQPSVLSIGGKFNETRGVIIKGINIVTNKYGYVDGVFGCLETGANIGLELVTVTFSKIRDIIISGNNKNAIYGIKFNGFETYFNDIMFRKFGIVGGSSEFAFYNYTRTNEGVYSSPSGMRYVNVSFEGVACSWMRLSWVDFQVDGVNGEIAYIDYGDNVNIVSPSELPTDYTPLCLFAVTGDVAGATISNVTLQNLGRFCYSQDNNYYCQDTIVRTDDVYGDFSCFTIDNVYCQNNGKDVYAINYLYPNTNVNSEGDFKNKTIKGVNNILVDNYNVLYKLKDNCIARNGLVGGCRKNGFLHNENHRIVSVMNNNLYPIDCDIQHNVCFDNSLQREYLRTIRKKYTAIENLIAIFKTNDVMDIGYHNIGFEYQLTGTKDTQIVLRFVFVDGSSESHTLYLISDNSGGTKQKIYNFYNSSSKQLKEIILINNNKAYNLKLFKFNISTTPDTECVNKLQLKEGVNLHDFKDINLDDMITENSSSNRLLKIGFLKSLQNNNPTNIHGHYISFDMGSMILGKKGTQFFLPGEASSNIYYRNGADNMASWRVLQSTSLNTVSNVKLAETYIEYKKLDTPLHATRMTEQGIYEEYVSLMNALELAINSDTTLPYTIPESIKNYKKSFLIL